jgi:hypothetical protein
MRVKMTKTLKIWVPALLSMTSLAACVYGPKTDKKSTLDYLHGENYETSAQGPDHVVVPIIKTKERHTHIQGAVVIGESDTPEIPLRFVGLTVFSKENQRMASTSTDSDGKFSLGGVLANGTYTLRIESSKYRGELMVEINSYDVKDITVRAQKVRKN